MLTLSRPSRLRAGAVATAIITAMAVMGSSVSALAVDGEPLPETAVEVVESTVDLDASADAFGAPVEPTAEIDAAQVEPTPVAEPVADAITAVPMVSVSKTDGLVDGETVTVSGENFSPVAPSTNGTRPPLAGQFGGVYVVFGSYAETWKPSEGASSASRKAAPGQTRWVVNPENLVQIGGSAAGAVAIESDGSFEVQLTVTEEFTGMLENGNLGIFTFSGSGAVYAPFETETFVSFAEPAPTVSVSKTDGLVDGETVTVSGENFSPVAPSTNGTRPPLAGQFGGVYVVFGSYAETWKPSEGATSAARKAAPAQTRWVVNPANVAQLGGSAAGAVAIEEDGSFEVELTVTDDFEGMLENGNLGIYTFSGSGAVYAPFETETFLRFAGPVDSTVTLTADPAAFLVGASTTLSAIVQPAVEGSVEFFDGERSLGVVGVDRETGVATLTYADAPQGPRSLRAVFTPADLDVATGAEGAVIVTVSAPIVMAPTSSGSLRWGVKQSFRTYVTGPIAQGTIGVAGAGSDGAIVVFPQSSPAAATDVVQYGGSVRYLGHNGALDVTIASPTVRLVSNTRADLVATVNGSRVTLATLALATGARSVLPDGAVRYAGVAATLTAAGAPAFSFGGTAFYPAGTALDPVTFTIGAPSSAGGGTRIVGAFTGSSIPTAPPATTGAELIAADAGALEPGQRITLTAAGFAPGESDIAVVAYSDPIVLSESVTADADGVATWTGTLPADLIGVHTLTMQGSVDRGIVVTIRELAQSVSLTGACVIQDARLQWGFKEAFRAYVSGSIANGEWQVFDGAEYETPSFAFAGDGALDSSTGEGELVFSGGIRFTGHGGILDTSVSNPRVIVLDADTAQLVLDVVGTTQEGVAVEAEGVVFADLDLSAAARSADDGLLTIEGALATLTATGAEAFGTYPAGEPLDPVTITGSLADDCGEVVIAEPEAGEVAPSEGGIPLWVWGIIIALLLAVIALTVALVRRRAAAE
ncbi:HtaA domain-containing protein [Microcella sp.]|uniref:HtaA domain-containing protein n=1 Tax=Microcella sp. TaxID=1913979 RepID=UPI002568BFD9|nr:HtaA domain-containing protein [Microcella sp.]MBX9471725.1 HtaA domain-containing protein [Microcella sp.]